MRRRRHPRFLLLAAALGVLLALAPLALAWRGPTSGERRAITAAAVRALSGSGWKVSHIRVSTVRTRDRYAAAGVENRTGVGGEMILRLRNGRWSELFLGTSDFCRVNAPRAVLDDLGFACSKPRLRARPTSVAAGATLTLTGDHFLHGTRVVLYAGPPHSEGARIGSTRADRNGNFRATVRVSAGATAGRYVALACQASCTFKATASFTITR